METPDTSEVKLLKARIALLEKINSTTNSIINQIEFSAQPILAHAENRKVTNEGEATLNDLEFNAIYGFLHRVKNGQFNYINETIDKLIDERQKYRELLQILA